MQYYSIYHYYIINKYCITFQIQQIVKEHFVHINFAVKYNIPMSSEHAMHFKIMFWDQEKSDCTKTFIPINNFE